MKQLAPGLVFCSVGSRFRFTNMANTVIGYDDVSIRPYVEVFEPGPLTMGFENNNELVSKGIANEISKVGNEDEEHKV